MSVKSVWHVLNSSLIKFPGHRGAFYEYSQSANLCWGVWSLWPYHDLFWKQHVYTCKRCVYHWEWSLPKGAKMKRAWSHGRGLKGEWRKFEWGKTQTSLYEALWRVKGRVTREQVCNKRSWEDVTSRSKGTGAQHKGFKKGCTLPGSQSQTQ